MLNNTSIKTGLKVEIQIQFLVCFFVALSSSVALAVAVFIRLISPHFLSLSLSLGSGRKESGVINRWCPMCFSSPVVLSLLLFHSPPFPVSAHRTPSPTACSFLSAERESLEQPGLQHTCTNTQTTPHTHTHTCTSLEIT